MKTVKRNPEKMERPAPWPPPPPERKQRKPSVIPAKAGIQDTPARKADTMLDCIRRHKAAVEKVEARYNKEAEALQKKYEAQTRSGREALTIAEQSLIALMKKERASLFVGRDILKLENGSLIFNSSEKVSIPKDAVERLKAQNFLDAIRTVEFADRDVIEKWPDAKLLLIGALRKTKEEFGYELARSAR